MICNTPNKILPGAVFLSLFLTYWAIFIGSALMNTLRLSLKGQTIYHVLDAQILRASKIKNQFTLRNNDSSNNLRRVSPSTHDIVAESAPSSGTIKIPFFMHRMWRDSSIPDVWVKEYQKCNEFYQQRNWTIILWTDDSIRTFLATHFSDFIPVFERYPFDIQRVDAARYFILYHYGGMYLDMDVGCRAKKDATDLVQVLESMNMGAMFPLTNPFGMSNDVMIATKGNHFLKTLIDSLPASNTWYGMPYLTVLYSTGPMFMSLVYMEYARSNEDILALSPSLYSETDGRFFRHLKGGTWHGQDARMIIWIFCNWRLLSVLSLVLLVGVQGIGRVSKPHRLSL